ncbi:hypothetical protein SB763_33785, partial [Burkholderia sp. SIMBA_042]|uniref:hypothetical protein n=1 Tax=Burkholderia sp. SIMBA_042 TaxID=3085783 RepID=UPI00397B0DE1
FTLDTSAAAPGVVLANDSGSSASDHITNVSTLNLTGIETGATVEYSTDGGDRWSAMLGTGVGVCEDQGGRPDITSNTSVPTSFSFT